MAVIASTLLIVINAVSLVGNVFVALTVYKSPRLRTTSDIYIFALAFTDVLWSTCVMPFAAATLITGNWIFGDAICEFQASIDYFALYSSPATMGLAAFNRYLRIVKPHHYRKVFSPKRSKLLLAMIWVLLVAYIVIARSTSWENFEFIPEYALCSTVFSSENRAVIHYCILIPIFFLFPLIVFVFSYYHVYTVIRRHNHSIGPNLQTGVGRARVTIQEIRVSKSLFLIISVFVACWVPTWVIALVNRFCSTLAIPRGVNLLPVFLPFLSSAVNPFVYGGGNATFRSEFRKLFCEWRRSRVSAGTGTRIAQADVHQLPAVVMNHLAPSMAQQCHENTKYVTLSLPESKH